MECYIYCSHHNNRSTWFAPTCTHKYEVLDSYMHHLILCISMNQSVTVTIVKFFGVCVYVHLKVHQYSRKVVYIFYPLTKASEFKNIFLFLLPGHFFLSHFNFFNEFYVYFSALLSFYINETRELCSHSCLPIIMEVTFNFMGY